MIQGLFAEFRQKVLHHIFMHSKVHHFELYVILVEEVVPEVFVFLFATGAAAGSRIFNQEPGYTIFFHVPDNMHAVVVGGGFVTETELTGIFVDS